VADYWGFYSGVPLEALYVWNGGLALWGGVLGATAGGLWHARRRGMPLGRLADVSAAAGLWGMALGRLGDLLAGERPATPTSLPWGVEYAHPDSAAYIDGVAVHPAALYEMLLDVAVVGVLWRLGARRRAGRPVSEGASFVLAIALYAVGRFFIGFVRVDPSLLGLQQAQWVALAVLAGAAAYAWREWRSTISRSS
jgi:prolipoprotein diacylglyceryltransferase